MFFSISLSKYVYWVFIGSASYKTWLEIYNFNHFSSAFSFVFLYFNWGLLGTLLMNILVKIYNWIETIESSMERFSHILFHSFIIILVFARFILPIYIKRWLIHYININRPISKFLLWFKILLIDFRGNIWVFHVFHCHKVFLSAYLG